MNIYAEYKSFSDIADSWIWVHWLQMSFWKRQKYVERTTVFHPLNNVSERRSDWAFLSAFEVTCQQHGWALEPDCYVKSFQFPYFKVSRKL